MTDASTMQVDAITVANALGRCREAQAKYEAAHDRCVRWTEAHGVGVWREGHPSDRQKLRDRRLARRELAAERAFLQQAVLQCPPAGAA
jgi:hypothetical protein